jgi:predicted methyltransferase
MLKARSTLAFVLGLLAIAACGGGNETSPPPSTATAAQNGAAPQTPAADSATKDVKEVKASSLAVPPYVRTAVDAADRTPEDKALDGGRKPDLVLSFLGIKPGMKVADLAAGGGYTTELLVRTVGPQGKVYGQNSQEMLDRFLQKPWSARTARPVNAQLVGVARAFDDPLPEDAKDLDAVVMVLFYHDLYWVGTDRAKMNAAIMKSLKPGGIFGIVDHSGRTGTGSTEVKSLHRIEEKEVVADVTKAGFKLVESTDALREPDDKRDWNASPMQAGEKRGHSDRFVLKFQKP